MNNPPWRRQELIFLFALIVGVELLFTANHASVLLSFAKTADLSTKKTISLLYVLVLRIIELFLLFYYTFTIKKEGWKIFGFSRSTTVGHFLFAGKICLFFGSIVLLGELIVRHFFSQPLLRNLLVPRGNVFFSHTPYLTTYIIVAVIVAPFVEEIFFRGILYPVLRTYLNAPLAILSNAFIFAAAHGVTGSYFPVQCIGGILFAALFERTSSVIPSYLVHSCGNLAIVGIIYYYKVFL